MYDYDSIVEEIRKYVQNPFSEEFRAKQGTLEEDKYFQMLTHDVMKEIPQDFFESGNLSAKVFEDLFRKHNMLHLFKRDNLIFTSLSQEKSLTEANLGRFSNLGPPGSRQEAIMIL